MARTLTWKQGVLIVLGIPILILPSVYDVSGILWAFSIVLWTVSVIQGFLQNTAFGEMVTLYPDVSGIPDVVDRIITPENSSRYNWKKFIAAFGAWGYWFAWTPAPAVFSIVMTDYLVSYFPFFAAMNYTLLSVTIGVVVIGGFALVNLHGLSGGAKAGLVLGMVAIIPIVIILGSTYFNGFFQFSNISGEWLPPSWSWSTVDIVMLMGCLGLAQWSSCAWEGSIIYGCEYKKPSIDVPKALFASGIICLILYFFMSFSIFGALGVEGIGNAGYATLVPIAIMVFGEAGSAIAIAFLLVAMLLIIQTGFLGGSRSMYALARSGQMPKFFTKLNKNGTPAYTMLLAFIVNVLLILVGNPIPIIAASGMAYGFGIGVSLAAYFISKTNPKFKDIKRGWNAPRGWKWVALVMMFYQLFILIPCLFYWNLQMYGAMSTVMAVFIVSIYIPIWIMVQRSKPEKSN